MYELNLDRVVEEQGWKVPDLQRAIIAAGGKATNLRQWINGKVMPRGKQICMLAEVLEVNPGVLFRMKG